MQSILSLNYLPRNRPDNTVSVNGDGTKPPQESEIPSNRQALRDMYFLAVAYSSNVGGTGSLVGTGPNLIVKSELER